MSAWLEHVKATMKLNKGKPLKVVLKLAKKTYKKGENIVKKTGSVVKYAVTGKKTRKHKKTANKTRKHNKKTNKKTNKKANKKANKKTGRKHKKTAHKRRR
tara:strand:- start:321 stop:623 length:303 start_codon:yes stop_codon:yes gene_type:complete